MPEIAFVAFAFLTSLGATCFMKGLGSLSGGEFGYGCTLPGDTVEMIFFGQSYTHIEARSRSFIVPRIVLYHVLSLLCSIKSFCRFEKKYMLMLLPEQSSTLNKVRLNSLEQFQIGQMYP